MKVKVEPIVDSYKAEFVNAMELWRGLEKLSNAGLFPYLYQTNSPECLWNCVMGVYTDKPNCGVGDTPSAAVADLLRLIEDKQ